MRVMKLKEYLKKKRYTIHEAAELCGISKHTFYSYVRGQRIPGVANMAAIVQWTRGQVQERDFFRP